MNSTNIPGKPSLTGCTSRRRKGVPIFLALAALALLASLFYNDAPYRPTEALPVGIVDMHCHVAGIGSHGSRCFVGPRLRESYRFRFYLGSFGVTEEELAEHGDGLLADRLSARLAQSRYVSKAVVLALDGVIDSAGNLDSSRTQVYLPNEFVVAIAAAHSNLLFGASVNPYRSDALQRLNWAKEKHAELVKWIPSIKFDLVKPCKFEALTDSETQPHLELQPPVVRAFRKDTAHTRRLVCLTE